MMRDRMTSFNMEARGLIIFSLVIVQAFSAPNGCIEFCTGQQNAGSSYESSSSYRSHSKIVQGANVQGVNHLNYDYRRPGNWTEHNEYVTDGGHGKVYEEKGQYVEGPKRVSYYKKNYSSSHSTGDLGDVDVLTRIAQVPSATHAVDQEYEYDRQRHRQQIRVHPIQVVQPVDQTVSHSERHDEYSQQQASQTIQHGEIGSQIVQGQHQEVRVRPEDNWRVVDSHRTDGGHGQVYEEHGQYVDGPSKVRYYRRNYTASYGTPGNIVVTHQVPVTDNLQRPVEDVRREYEDLRRRSEHLSSVHDVSTTGQNIGLSQIGRPQVDTVINTHVVPQPHIVSDEHSSENRYQKTSSRRVYGQTPVHTDGSTQQVVNRLVVQPQVYPTQNVYRKEHHTVIEGQYQPTVAQPIIYVPSDNAQNVLSSTSHIDDRHSSQTNLHQTSVTGITSNSHLSENLGSISSNSHPGQLVHGQRTVVYPATTSTGHVQQYEEHWKSSGHVKGSTVPQDQIISQSTLQNSGYGSEFHWVPSGQLTTGAIDLGQVSTHSVDCTNEAAEHVSRYHRLYKRNVKTGRRRAPIGDYFHDYRNRPAVPATEGQQTQESDGYRRDVKPEETQQLQPNGYGGYTKPDYDYTQKPARVPIGGRRPEDFTQQNEDLQQHTGGLEDFSQGKPKDAEFEKQKWQNFERIPADNQQLEDFGQQNDDLEQHTGGFDDFTQQPSANLEFGQHAQKPQKLQTTGSNQQVEDFDQYNYDSQQHTSGFDDFTQQSSADLEFGQYTQKPQKPSQVPNSNQNVAGFTQQGENLQQHIGGFDDFTQQTSGNIELGHPTQKPLIFPTSSPTGNRHLGNFRQHNDSLEQQTGGFDDFSQQMSGNLEFGQHITKPQKPGQHHDDFTQQNEDLQQHTGGFDDFTQQTSGNLEFDQHMQKPQNLHTRPSGNQHLEDFGKHNDDLEQQTGGFDDFSQQMSGNFEFGQHVTKPQEPGQHHGDFTQQEEDLQQHTGGFDDFPQHPSANIEFGQHTQKPQNLETTVTNQHVDDFGQYSDDSQSHTGGFDDLTQQTSGNLEFGQHNRKLQRLPTGNQHLDDFGHHDEHLGQQTSGNLEFGQHQKPQKPQRPGQVDEFTQQNEDLQQHSGGFDDFAQQTSGNLEFGQQTWKPDRVPPSHQQENEDLQQHTGSFDDFTQQTSGNLEFGQQTWKPGRVPSNQQQTEDLQQHTGGFDDFTQQTSGHLEFGQQTQQSGQHRDDYTQQNQDFQQQTGGFDDFTQQTSGNLEFGQQTQQNEQHLNDFTQQNQDFQQQTGGFDDFTQQSSGHLELGHQEEKTEKPVLCQSSICRKPAPKPTPRPRPGHGSRYGLETLRTPAPVQQQENTWQPHGKEAQQSSNVPVVEQHQPHDIRGEISRGDQVIDSTTGKSVEVVPQTGDEQQTEDWGENWHQRHKPSDLTSEYTQQQSRIPDFTSQSQTHFNQDDVFSQQQQTTLEQIPLDQKPSAQFEQSQIPEDQKIKQEWEQQTDEIKTEPRILEAYGGSGPYDPTHDENIFSKVTVNPSATLPPHVDTDLWIIREKPVEVYNPPPLYYTSTPAPTTTTEAAPPSFWGRVGNKITSTFGKAKEKAKEVFG